MTKNETKLLNILNDGKIHSCLGLREFIPCSLPQACQGLRKKGFKITTTVEWVNGARIGYYQLDIAAFLNNLTELALAKSFEHCEAYTV